MLGSTMDEGMNKTRRGYCTEYARAHISSSRQVRRLLFTLRQDIPTDTKVVNNAFLDLSFLFSPARRIFFLCVNLTQKFFL